MRSAAIGAWDVSPGVGIALGLIAGHGC